MYKNMTDEQIRKEFEANITPEFVFEADIEGATSDGLIAEVDGKLQFTDRFWQYSNADSQRRILEAAALHTIAGRVLEADATRTVADEHPRKIH